MIVAACAALAAGALAPCALALAPDALKERVERTPRAGARATPDETAIRQFYAKRNYRPLWFAEARMSAQGGALLDALAKAAEHGLNPALYGMPELEQRMRNASSAEAEAELALTRVFLDYAGDITSGVIANPRRTGRSIGAPKRWSAGDLLDAMAAAEDPAAFLRTLPPDRERYEALKGSLARYRQIEREGGWPSVSRGASLKPGMRGRRVAEMKRRLLATGELPALGQAEIYDGALVAAVKSFQRRHGLTKDGVAGADTLAEMNIPVAARIEQILINLERRRWLGGNLGQRYVYLNIADNALKLVENEKTVHVARVIVGKPYQQTPVFSATLTQIEVNPYWNVPQSIAVNELLPAIQRKPGYLHANDYLLLTRSGDNASAVNPLAVNWAAIGPGNFPFHIRQRPGPKNALGTLLFRMPNPHNVFLHDTPHRDLFDRGARFFSHGCMRVEFPLRLALLLLGDQDGGAWSEARINAIIATQSLTVIKLARPIPVHVTYLTAWAERDGTMHFRRDVYHRDVAVVAAYRQATRAR